MTRGRRWGLRPPPSFGRRSTPRCACPRNGQAERRRSKNDRYTSCATRSSSVECRCPVPLPLKIRSRLRELGREPLHQVGHEPVPSATASRGRRRTESALCATRRCTSSIRRRRARALLRMDQESLPSAPFVRSRPPAVRCRVGSPGRPSRPRPATSVHRPPASDIRCRKSLGTIVHRGTPSCVLVDSTPGLGTRHLPQAGPSKRARKCAWPPLLLGRRLSTSHDRPCAAL